MILRSPSENDQPVQLRVSEDRWRWGGWRRGQICQPASCYSREGPKKPASNFKCTLMTCFNALFHIVQPERLDQLTQNVISISASSWWGTCCRKVQLQCIYPVFTFSTRLSLTKVKCLPHSDLDLKGKVWHFGTFLQTVWINRSYCQIKCPQKEIHSQYINLNDIVTPNFKIKHI